MNPSSSNVAIIQSGYAAFASGDIPSVLGIMDADITWHEPDGFIYPGTFRGPDEVLNKLFVRLGTEWDGWKAVPEEFVANESVVAVFGNYSGTYRKTGKSIRSPFVHYWRLQHGKVVEFRTYMDTVLIRDAVS